MYASGDHNCCYPHGCEIKIAQVMKHENQWFAMTSHPKMITFQKLMHEIAQPKCTQCQCKNQFIHVCKPRLAAVNSESAGNKTTNMKAVSI